MTPQTVIGLEIHAQLRTRSKAFCGCSTAATDEPNTHTCPVCLGHPGALPVLNAAMPRAAVLLGRATGCSIRPRSTFARKHYFYPDLVKGYQITQHRDPICERGILPYRNADGALVPVTITRMHMEEDAARLKHTADASLVDYNRAGHPLLEIVTAPEFSRPADAAAFVRTLRQLLRYLGICDGDMETGSLRCDANISLRDEDGSAGARSEIKNLNSFRSVERALAWENARQRAAYEAGTPGEAATLLWDEDAQEARFMRGKESAAEYHYLPEPDLPPVSVTTEMIAAADAAMPELPWQRRDRYVTKLGLPARDADVLTAERDVAEYFEEVLTQLVGSADDPGLQDAAKETANWVMTTVLHDMRVRESAAPDLPAARLAALISCVRDGVVSASAAREVFPALRTDERPVEEIIASMGLRQLRDAAALTDIIDAVIADHPQQLAAFRGGRQQVFAFFIGQVMRRSGGAADPVLTRALLERALAERDDEGEN